MAGVPHPTPQGRLTFKQALQAFMLDGDLPFALLLDQEFFHEVFAKPEPSSPNMP
jgi:hypothetical protein